MTGRVRLPLSPGQRGLWFLHRLHPDGSAYHLALASRIRTPTPAGAIRDLFQAQVDRHGALRTTFPLAGEDPVQHVAAPSDHVRLAFEEIDAAGWDEASFRARLEEEAWKPFDLENGPLFRVQVVHRPGGERVLLVVAHHIVMDFGSFAGMLAGTGEGERLQYRDFLGWQEEMLAGPEGERLWSFWREALAGLPVLELPADRPRWSGVAERGGCRWHEIGPGVVRELRRLARSEGATLYVALLAGFQALLSRYTGQTDFAVGSPASGRPKGFARTMGYFTNPLPLRADLSGGPSFRELIARTRQRVSEALDHQHLPLPLLVERLRSEGREGDLFRTLLVYHRDPPGLEGMVGFALGEGGGLLRWSDLELEPLTLPPRAAQLDLMLAAGERRGALGLQLVYDADLFDGPTAGRWLEHLAVLLEAAAARPEAPVGELPLLTPWERQQVLVEANDQGEADLPWARLEEGFERQAERIPEAVALIDGEQRITYRELRDRANALAEHLMRLGVGPEQVVGVRMPRTAELVSSLLGVLKSGAAYVPLDPSSPEQRIAFLLEEAGARWVVGPGGEVLPPLPVGGRVMGEGGRGGEDRAGSGLAYLIYTSGSTGRPKGVAIEHAGAVRLVAWAGRTCSREELSGVLASTSISFDLSIFEIFVPLSFGGTVILAENALALPSLPAAGEVTLINTVPSAIAALLDLGPLPPSVRTVNLAGEPLRRSLADRVLACGVRLWDLYGPSEDTTYSTGAEVRAGDAGEPVIGRPVAGSRAYVLDAGLHPLPVGIPGELCLGGGGLARGYRNRPELTAERFVPDALSGEPGSRLYRTGDLARRRPDGALEYLGRLDQQVKIRGFRIEPGEIEAALLSHPRVREAAVVVREDSLVACLSLQPQAPPAAELRDLLAVRLPSYMIPAAFVTLDALPLTPNGKVDRRALADLAAGAVQEHALNAPRSPVEEALAEIWSEALGGLETGGIGIHDDFFSLGGHSLLATRVASRVRSVFDVDLPVRSLFEAPTIAGLAARIEAARSAGTGTGAPPLVPVPRDGGLPLSFAQQRLWFLHRLDPGSAAYHIAGSLRLYGYLCAPALERALLAVEARHEALRTTFADSGEGPVQVIGSAAERSLPFVDLSELPDGIRDAEAGRIEREEGRRAFDLTRGPLLRALLLRLGSGRQRLAVAMHHIVSDGWSLGVLLRELGMLYPALAEGRTPPPLPELPVQVADHAVWQRRWLQGDALQSRLAWWEDRLAGAEPELRLPTDRPRPAGPAGAGETLRFRLASDLTRELEDLSRRRGATLFMTLLAGWSALLHRYSNQRDLAVGSPIAGRDRFEIEGLIGFFVNTLVLRIRLEGEEGFGELLERVRQVTLGAYDHQDLPFDKLVEELRPDRAAAPTPLFQVLLALQNAPWPALQLPGLSVGLEPLDLGAPKVDLALTFEREGEELSAALEYRSDLFDAPTVSRLARHLESLLAAAGAERPVGLLPLLSEDELRQILGEWSGSRAPAARELIPRRIEARAAAAPEAPAVRWGAESWTWRDLDRRSNGLAWRLCALGVGPEVRVAVLAERLPWTVAAQLAVWKAGGAYVPLDPSTPPERLAWLLRDSGVRVLLAGAGEGLPPLDAEVLLLGEAWEEAAEAPPAAIGPESLAYVIYTSGSTGVPKGVEVCHGSLRDLTEWHARTFAVGPRDVAGHVAGLGFDAAVWEVWSNLAAGASLVLADEEARSSPERLHAWMVAEGISIGFAPVALAEPMLALDWSAGSLRILVTGTERLRARPRPDLPFLLWNGYGPTECTVIATAGRVAPGGAGLAPTIGRPVANTLAWVLDDRLQPVPPGVAGELLLGGAGVARGYLGRPDLTAERFLPDPFRQLPGARMYRTGDLVRWRADGELDFLGRIDDQVKIRGFRIEPGEIERSLMLHPGVREAVVLALGDPSGDKRLVAFVSGPAAPGELRDFLARRLPPYMVPASFAMLEALPLTANGKVDRRALAALEVEAAAESGLAAPRGPVEEALVEIWAEALGNLGMDRIGIHDDFFALGGHSLLATRVVSRVRSVFGVELPVRTLFDHPTVAGLAWAVEVARHAGGTEPEAPPLVPVPRGRPLPLSFTQHRLWLAHELDPEGAAYHVAGALRLAGRLDLPALARILEEIARRHESLRTRFGTAEGEPVQVIDATPEVRLAVADLEGLTADLREREAARMSAEVGRRPFDPGRGPLIRTVLLRLDRGEHRLAVAMHHIVSDGWSLGVLFREIGALYPALAEGGSPAPLPDLPVQVADFAVWQRAWLRGEALRSRLAWWERQLAGAEPLLRLPTDRPRPAGPLRGGRTVRFRLPGGLTESLESLGRRHGATLFMTLLAGWKAVLSRHAGQSDLSVGSPIANRNRVEIEGVIGCFVNTLVLRTRLEAEEGFGALLARVREGTLGAYDHQDLPFEKLVEALRPDRTLAGTPLFQVLFALQNAPRPRLELPGLRLDLLPVDLGASQLDLALTLERDVGDRGDGGGLAGSLELAAELFDESTIARMARHWETLLAGAAADPDRPVGLLPLLTQEERAQLLELWSPAPGPPPGGLLHERAAAWAARTPEAPAVRFEGETLSYRELDRRAGRLAGHLISRGVRPGDRVGLWLERSAEVIVGILGILKAGAAWLPLDTGHPLERLAFMARDGGIAALVTTAEIAGALEALSAALPQGTVRVLLDADREAIERSPEAHRLHLPGASLAYVLYTSGSMGRPKGVACHHAGVLNLIDDVEQRAPIAPGTVCSAWASFSFDASVYEVFSALVHGGCLDIAPERVRADGCAFAAWLGERRVGSAFVLPTFLGDLAAAMERIDIALVRIKTGVETIPEALAARLVALRPGLRIVNGYGPTEATICATLHVKGEPGPGDGNLPLGPPARNCRVHVLDPRGELLPLGVPGEACIAGAGLAWGYHGRPDLTAERFVPDPYGEAPGERMYRTGDLVRWLPGGNLSFVGRVDHQVKVRGVRIEPGEIEAVLRERPEVRDAVVAPRSGPGGERRLVAWVVGEAPPAALREFLRARLPEAMVPSAFVPLETLPLTVHGKVDRAALPDPDWQHPDLRGAGGYVAPRTEVEELLAGLWQDLLGVERVGIHDSFFDLGGHSLKAGQLALRVRDLFDVELPVRAVFDAPTVAGLAVTIARKLVEEADADALQEVLTEMTS